MSDLASASDLTALLVVHSECPTSVMALKRLGAAADELERRGCRLAVLAEEAPAAAASLARRHAVEAQVLAQEEPYAVSEALDVRTVPTTILLDRRGVAQGRVVGWDRDALSCKGSRIRRSTRSCNG